MNKKRINNWLITRHIVGILFLVYIFEVLWITLFSRKPEKRDFIPEIFWGFRVYFTYGQVGLKIVFQYAMNIILFIPFGLLFPWKRKGCIPLMISAMLLSANIELLQFIFCLGLSEIDDVVANTLGAIIGWHIFILLKKLIYKVGKDSI